MKHCVEIPIPGTEEYLTELFSYSQEDQASGLTRLTDFIAHCFNNTLRNDGHYGAWAQVIQNSESEYVLKMYSPHKDVSEYPAKINAYLNAGQLGLSIYKANQDDINKAGKGKIRFLLPFGLSMTTVKSVQLLHFPPLETFVYKDYLYSPTNRRWENLLGCNGELESHCAPLESIVDCVPLAAMGDNGAGIADFNNTFTQYVNAMLKARLTVSNGRTQPVVAYGGPVRTWLKDNYSKQITSDLGVLSLLELDLYGDGTKTDVLCANHPSMYLYYTDDTKPEDQKAKKEVMTQDLIAAGWQYMMTRSSGASAKETLHERRSYWTNNPLVDEIMKKEDEDFGYSL